MDKLWRAAGAAAWGAACACGLPPFYDENCPEAKTVLIGAFPYYAGRDAGNLSLYCRGEDYHRVLLRRLEPICAALRKAYPDFIFHPSADNSPVPEIAAAEAAGVGFRGKHGLLIVPPYGSFVFLGTILTDYEFPPTERKMEHRCPPACTACRDACPVGAVSEMGCDVNRCLSAVTQRKGELSPEEAEALRRSPTVWGCDACQTACPFNKAPALSPLAEFRKNLLCSVTLEDLEGMSNKAFRRIYADRAFRWRGIAPLLRNLQLHKEGGA